MNTRFSTFSNHIAHGTRMLAVVGLLSLLAVSPVALAAPAATPSKAPAASPDVKSADKATDSNNDDNKKAYDGPKGVLDPSYKTVDTLELVKQSATFVDQKVSFHGTFVSFNALALDYKAAMRDSKEFLSFVILRPDVNHHKIPLSELKLVYPRERVEAIREIQSGDKLLIRGKVFSAALGDPWVDVDDIIIIEKGPKHKAELEKQRKKAAKKKAQ
jgi:hypothetical protein